MHPEPRHLRLTSAVHLQNGASLPLDPPSRCPLFWQVQPLVRPQPRPLIQRIVITSDHLYSSFSPSRFRTMTPTLNRRTCGGTATVRSNRRAGREYIHSIPARSSVNRASSNDQSPLRSTRYATV